MSESTPRTEMKCIRCGCFSSAQVCWHCSNLPDAITYSQMTALEAENARLKAELDEANNSLAHAGAAHAGMREWKARAESLAAQLAAVRAAMKSELLEYRKQELYRLMSDISEDCYCAGWMSGNEFRLWDAATDQNDDGYYGQGIIGPYQRQRLHELSQQVNGWWVWEDDAAFISLDEWKRRLAAIRAAAGEKG